MKHYAQLTLEQRYQIQALLKMGHPYQEIATVIGVHKSTISREVRRNQGRRGYRPHQAHRFTLTRRHTKVRRRIPADMWYRVNRLLQEEWSPEQISGGCGSATGTRSVLNGSTNTSIATNASRGRCSSICGVSGNVANATAPIVVVATSPIASPSNTVQSLSSAAPGWVIGNRIRWWARATIKPWFR